MKTHSAAGGGEERTRGDCRAPMCPACAVGDAFTVKLASVLAGHDRWPGGEFPSCPVCTASAAGIAELTILVESEDERQYLTALDEAFSRRWGPRNKTRDKAIVRRAHDMWRLRNELVHGSAGAGREILADLLISFESITAIAEVKAGAEPSPEHRWPWPERPGRRKQPIPEPSAPAEVSATAVTLFLSLLASTIATQCPVCMARLAPAVTGEAVTAVRDAALQAVTEAIDVRDSIVRDDPSISRERVGRFAAAYLGITHPAGTEAVGAALLHLPLEPDDPGGDFRTERTGDLLGDLRRETRRQRRALRLIGETQLFGRCVASLDEPLPAPEPGTSTVGDVVACWRPRPDALPGLAGEFQDPRILRVLAMLKPMERAVAEAYAFGGGISWAEAEAIAAAPAGYGERVRRKLLRLGGQLQARTAVAHLRRAA